MIGKKIVILDAYATVPGDISWDPIAEMGDLTIYDRTPPELIAERIGDAQIVISSKVFIGREVFEQCPNLEYIGLLSTGYNVIDIDEVLRESDVILVAAPLNDASRDVIRKETIDKMKDGAIVINIARPGHVVEPDVVEALRSGKLRGFGADASSTEWTDDHTVLENVENCYLTPHIAWCPLETRQRMIDIVTENLRSYLAGNRVNCVNP